MVLPFRRTEPEMAGGYAAYGKLPNRDDFVRVNAHHPAVTEFDDLILRALERLTVRDGWSESYDRCGPATFRFVSGDLRHTLIGVLAPSRDKAGRRYPFVAVAISPGVPIENCASFAPIAHEVFFDGLRYHVCNAIENSVEALSCRQFLESQMVVGESAVADLELASGVVNRFMATTPVSRLTELLAGDGRGAALDRALLNLAFYRAFLRRFDNIATNQVAVFPLPDAEGEQALLACAWLSVIEALVGVDANGAGWQGNYATLRTSGGSTVISTGFSNSRDKLAAIALGANPDASLALDLHSEYDAWKNHRLYSEASYALSLLLEDKTLSVKDLCRFLRDVAQRLKETI